LYQKHLDHNLTHQAEFGLLSFIGILGSNCLPEEKYLLK